MKGYKEKVSVLKEEQVKEIDLLENKHREDIILFKEKINSSATVDTIQIENMMKLLKERILYWNRHRKVIKYCCRRRLKALKL